MVDWGTVPTWFSGIGTTATTAATLYIILRDRRASARRQGMEIIAVRQLVPDGKTAQQEPVPVYKWITAPIEGRRIERFLMTNTSPRPVWNPTLVMLSTDWQSKRKRRGEDDVHRSWQPLSPLESDTYLCVPTEGDWTLTQLPNLVRGAPVGAVMPGETVGVDVEWNFPVSYTGFYFDIRDAAGQHWWIDVKTSKLLKANNTRDFRKLSRKFAVMEDLPGE